MKKYVLWTEKMQFPLNYFNTFEFEVITFKKNPNVDERISHHADLSFFVADKEIFIAEEMSYLCNKLEAIGYSVRVIESVLSSEYPGDVKLNCVLTGKYFICNVDTVSECVLNFMKKKGKTVINVKQGYTKCSVIPVDDNAIITDDNAVADKCIQCGIDVLKVSKGNVILNGFAYGFIGGTAGVTDSCVYFNGDIHSHPDAERIVEFVHKYNKQAVSLAAGNLVDIGSLIFLTED